MAEAMKTGNISGGDIKKIIEEQEGIEKQEENISPESKKNKILMIVSALLFIGAVGIVFFLPTFTKKVSTVEPTRQFTPIIFTEKSQFIEVSRLSKEQIIQSIKNEVAGLNVKTGGIEGIYLTEDKQVIGLKRFMELIKANVPQDVLNYTNDNFLIGAWNGDTKSLFILLQVHSFTDIFPGMKSWENKMWNDLHTLFGMEISGDTSYLLTKDFEDSIVNNKNARALYDKEGKTVLEYIFADDTSVIVIANDKAVDEVMLRLQTEALKK